MSSFTAFYERLWREAAGVVGATLGEVAPGLWRVSRGDRSTLIQNYIVQMDDPVILNVAGDKALCHRLMMAEGLPVGAHEVFTLATLDKALAFMARHPDCAFVVKPAAGTSGARGVTTHLVSPAECRSAAALASLYGAQILIEQWIAGESYRLLFLDGTLIHASRRAGWWVVGDGTSSVDALMRASGAHGAAAHDHNARDVSFSLRAQNLSPTSVPERGRRVLVASTVGAAVSQAEIRTVFTHDATADIGEALRQECAAAARAIGSSFAGLDIITLDPGRSLAETGGVINEINTTPGLHHHYGLAGTAPAVAPAVAVLERLLAIESSSINASAKNFTAQLRTSNRP
jgi:cyanophycin synthetase